MLQTGAALLTAVSLPSCNGIFEGIYDEPSVIDEFGFTKVEQATSSGTIYIDATSYTRWNYLDFETFAPGYHFYSRGRFRDWRCD